MRPNGSAFVAFFVIIGVKTCFSKVAKRINNSTYWVGEGGKGMHCHIRTVEHESECIRKDVATHRRERLLYIVRKTLAGDASICESPTINRVDARRILHRNVACDARLAARSITDFCSVRICIMSQASLAAACPDALAFGCIGSRHVCSFG